RGGHAGVAKGRAGDVKDLDPRRDHRLRDGGRLPQLCGSGARDVEHEIAAAVVIVADEGRTGRHAGNDIDQVGRNAVPGETVEQHLAESIVADGTGEKSVRADPGGLVDEDPRGAARKGAGISRRPTVPAIAISCNELD